MTNVVTLENLVPQRRYDGQPWTVAKIEEAPSAGGTFSLIDTITLSPVDATPAAPVTRNFTTPNAVLPAGWYRVRWEDAASHISYSETVSPSQLGLISIERLKDRLDIDHSDTSEDTRLRRDIASASRAIINYTERQFGSPLVTETRTFLYDGSGALEIDDASNVTAAVITYPNAAPLPLTAQQWFAEPVERPQGVYTWLVVPRVDAYGGQLDRAMGFTYNLDTYEGGLPTQPTTVAVTGTFGWPAVPDDVQQAVEWTAAFIAERHDADKASESIEGYSQAWFPPTKTGIRQEALPQKAKDLLAPYIRVVA